MSNLAYVRVSSFDQHTDRQYEALKKYNIDKWFEEKVSGKNMNREELLKLLEYARPGDTIYVHDFSRLARNTKDLLQILEELSDRDIALISNKENFDLSTPTGKLYLTVMAAINEFERANLLERQREGIEIARQKGKFKGGQKKKVDEEYFEKCYADYMNRRIDKKTFAKRMGVAFNTLQRIIQEYETGVDELGNPGRFKKKC